MADIKINKIVMGAVMTNCYYVYREGSEEVIFFDPADNGNKLYEEMTRKGFRIAAIYLTHGHFDHIWGANELRNLSGCKLYALEQEKTLCEDASVNYSAQAGRPCTVVADEYLKDGDKRTEGDISFKVLSTPGHTGGSASYYFEEAGFIISGDTLFCGSVGRTDLPTGSESSIVRSLNDILLRLPGETKVYPGHGDATTIAYEKKYNPFANMV